MIDLQQNTDRRFLIDTSAFYSLSHDDMKSLIDKGFFLFASPYSCWELLCHLDEPNNFTRMKAILLKFQYVTILDSPSAKAEKALFKSQDDRISETEFVQACLAALQHADSLEALYSSYIHDSKNEYREIANVAERARDVLNKLETEYSQFATKIVTHFRTSEHIQDSANHQNLILNMVLGEFKKLHDRHPLAQLSGDEVIRWFYVYCGYIFYRCLNRLEQGGIIDKNDYEDSNFCLHLKIDSEFHPVTGDKGTLDALKQLVSITNESHEFQIVLKFRVYQTSDLKKLAAAA